jgi:hypothetical protein
MSDAVEHGRDLLRLVPAVIAVWPDACGRIAQVSLAHNAGSAKANANRQSGARNTIAGIELVAVGAVNDDCALVLAACGSFWKKTKSWMLEHVSTVHEEAPS